MMEKAKLPEWLIWLMTFINRIGFPILVCIYLGWIQLNMMPKIIEALNGVQIAISQNTEVLKSWRSPTYK